MKRLPLLPFLGAAIFVLSPVIANAFDACCWDWSPAPGANDGVPGGKPAGPISGLAQCTATPTVPAGKPCFDRPGRQMAWFNWYCVVGSHSPAGEAPTNLNSGFICSNKDTGVEGVQPAEADPEDPGILFLTEEPGPTAVEPTTWGVIKSLYHPGPQP
jgi:hypothetical protein